MPTITVRPKVAFDTSLYNSLQTLHFAAHDTPPPQQAEVTIREPNWYTKYVKHIYNANSTAAVIAKVVAAFFLGISIVGIPVLALFHAEVRRIDKDGKIIKTAVEKLDLSNQQWNKRGAILHGLGIHHFQDLPVLDLQGKMGPTGYLDFLDANEVSAPIMKGLDHAGRPFIAIKMTDTETNEDFVITVFQRYTNDSCWTHGINLENALSVQIGPRIKEQDMKIFRQVIQGNHPRFTLARS